MGQVTTPTASPTAFTERLVLALTPYFMHVADNQEACRNEILATLASYGARTRAEFLHAAQIIAFSLTALDLLVEAEAGDMSNSMRLRAHAAANALHRSAQRAQVTLEKRLACDIPSAVPPQADPVEDLSDEQIDEMLRAIQPPVETMNRLKPGANPYRPAKTRHPDTGLAHLFAAMAPPDRLAATA